LLPVLLCGAEVRDLAEEARRFAPEFAADAILRLASVAKHESAKWRRAQIEDAFHLAASARSRFKVTGRSAPGEPRKLDAFAADLELDGLSLQSGAVRAMLSVDAASARELFQKIVLPVPVDIPCEMPAPDFTAYYAAASQIMVSGFNAEERRRGEPFQLAMALLRGLRTAEQAGPAARMLVEAGLDHGDSQASAAAFAEALSGLSAGDASFSTAVWRDDLVSYVSALGSMLESGGAPVQPLAQSLRRFLVTHLTGSRCRLQAEDPRAALALRDSFNRLFGHVLQPIALEEVLPGSIGRGAAPQHDPHTAAISHHLRRLRMMDRNHPNWKELLRQASETIDAWDPGDLDSAEAFHRKAGLLQALLEVMPADDSRLHVLQTYTSMVSTSPVRRSHPAGWLWHAQVLRSRLRLSTASRLEEELEASGDGLIAYYAALERVAPEAPPVCSAAGVCPAMQGPDAMRAELLSFLFN
jgi:hypothetical protein